MVRRDLTRDLAESGRRPAGEPSDWRALLSALRNAEAVIRGYCDLADRRVVSPEQALGEIRHAVDGLSQARTHVAPDRRVRFGAAGERSFADDGAHGPHEAAVEPAAAGVRRVHGEPAAA